MVVSVPLIISSHRQTKLVGWSLRFKLIFIRGCSLKSNHGFTIAITYFKMLKFKFQKLQASVLDLRLTYVGSFNDEETLYCLYNLWLHFHMKTIQDHPSFWQLFYFRVHVSLTVCVREMSRKVSRTDLHWVKPCAPCFCQLTRDCVLDKATPIFPWFPFVQGTPWTESKETGISILQLQVMQWCIRLRLEAKILSHMVHFRS